MKRLNLIKFIEDDFSYYFSLVSNESCGFNESHIEYYIQKRTK